DFEAVPPSSVTTTSSNLFWPGLMGSAGRLIVHSLPPPGFCLMAPDQTARSSDCGLSLTQWLRVAPVNGVSDWTWATRLVSSTLSSARLLSKLSTFGKGKKRTWRTELTVSAHEFLTRTWILYSVCPAGRSTGRVSVVVWLLISRGLPCSLPSTRTVSSHG